MSLHIGDKAPDFSLYSSDKELTNLSELKGKSVVLLFFPLAFTSTCTKQMCSTRDDMEEYNALGVSIFGISVDSPQTLARYKQDYALNFTLLSDFNKEVIRAYDVMYEEFSVGLKGVGKRAAFLVDPEGFIRYVEVLENPGNVPDIEAIKNAIRNLQPA